MGTRPDEAALAALVEQLADAVVIADPSGQIVFWNGAAERVFGWPAAEAVGQSLDMIIPERQRGAHWDGYAKTMATGETKYATDLLRVPALNADGERHSIAFTVTLLHGPGGEVSGIAAVVRDETERWSHEQDLRRRLRELESEAAPE
ncbi:MAG: PAS domain S-box protein [Acidimicrobiales bacterium]